MLRQGVLLCALALLAVAHARMPRDTEKEREMLQKVGDSLRDTKQATSHEFFVLVQPEAGQKNSMEKTEELAKDFKKRLGEDKHVKVSPISKDKIYVHIRGDSKFSDEMVGALRSFKEVHFVERKPQYSTRERAGGRGTRRDRNQMGQRVPPGQDASSATM